MKIISEIKLPGKTLSQVHWASLQV